MTRHVTVELTEAQAAALDSEAARGERSVEAIVTDLIQRQVEHDTWFRAEVQKGLDDIERGDFFTQEQVVEQARFRREELLARQSAS